MSMSSSAPRPSDQIELETVVNWPMLISAAGLAMLLLAVPLVLACVAALKGVAVQEPVALQPKAPQLKPATAAPLAKPARPLVHPQPEEKPKPLPIYVRGDRPPLPPLPPEPPRRAVAVKPPPPLDPVLQFPESKESKELNFKRLDEWPEEDLAQLLGDKVKEVDLESVTGTRDKLLEQARTIARTTPRAASTAKVDVKDPSSILALRKERADLRGLPMREGADCQADAETTKKRQEVSRKLAFLRRARRTTFSRSSIDFPEQFPEITERIASDTISTVMQIVQVEHETVREALMKRLSASKEAEVSAVLAHHALFDLSPRVRQEAVKALQDRPKEEYRQAMLDGLRYPWAPVAVHAAEALAALEDRAAVVPLIDLLDAPDPCEPVVNADKKWVVRELVRVNHLRNCLLCHAPSLSLQDPIRGVVPTPGQPLPQMYYAARKGDFVRADVTYLRQDFSRMERVAKPDKWPERQRFDYLVRSRELTADEVAAYKKKPRRPGPTRYAQRDAVLFALRELTGAAVGYDSADWREYLRTCESVAPK